MFYGHVLWTCFMDMFYGSNNSKGCFMRSNNSKIGQMTVKGCFMRSNNSKIGQMTVKIGRIAVKDAL